MTGGNDGLARLRTALHPRYDEAMERPGSMPDAALDLALASARAAYDLTRDELRATYGWPAMTADFQRDTAAGVIRCMVRSASPRAVSLLCDVLRDAPQRIEVIAAPMPPIERRELRRDVTPVWRALPHSSAPPVLATELMRDDGPVQMLAATRGFLLIRSTDDTLGWIDARDVFARAVAAHSRRLTTTATDWRTAVRSYLGVPYKLGGATRDGIDCSALAQRIYSAVLGETLPRHSADQQHIMRTQPHSPIETGDLLFVRTPTGTLHVGIALRERRVTVVHASCSRGEVVVDELERFAS